jgi:hypothetical protein
MQLNDINDVTRTNLQGNLVSEHNVVYMYIELKMSEKYDPVIYFCEFGYDLAENVLFVLAFARTTLAKSYLFGTLLVMYLSCQVFSTMIFLENGEL